MALWKSIAKLWDCLKIASPVCRFHCDFNFDLSLEQQFVDKRIQYVNFWPEEKKERVLERVKELREERILELEQKYQFLNENPAYLEALQSRD
jgi:hypothetical protein